MKRLTSACFMLLLLVTQLMAVEDGQTVRLVLGGKSVLTENSSLDENKNALLWTETNTNSQRWTLSVTARGTYQLQNDYTGFYLGGLTSASSGNVGQISKSNATTRGSWEFVPVEGTANQYTIYLGTTRKYALAAPATVSEGSQLTIVNTAGTTAIDPARITWTVEVVDQMAKEFTKDKRDDMMNAWKKRAYKQASTGWVIGGGGWWGDAEMFEIVLDALETTGDQQYATMFDNLYTNFIARNKSTWYQQGVSGYNEYNDDIAWMCIACVRAYLLTGQAKYRTTAKNNFDGMFKRADCYGNDLLQWKHNSGQGTNSCINGPAAVCACYLAIATADMSYYEKAKKTYLAERATLFEMSGGKPTGKIWDSYNQESKSYNYWASTYNQGTNLGAAIMLYNYYGDPMFKEDADAIIKWSEANMANSKGIIHVCQTVRGDLCGFKGIMLRYLRMYAESFNAPSHLDWIKKNAYHAWNNRNSAGITSSAWLTKAEENFKHVEGSETKDFGHDGNMTCVSAAFNCHLGAVESHDAYAKNEAEDFNFVRNAPVTYSGNTDDGGGMVGTMKNTNYIGYRRVDFGDKPASHIDLRAYATLASATVNVFLDQPNAKSGTLLCAIKGSDLVAIKTWDTARKMLNVPVTGVHDVYLVASGSGLSSVNWWQFQSLNPVYPDLTNGGGRLTSSIPGADCSALTDADVSTYFTADMTEPGQVWLQYESPSPVQLYAYQIFSGNAASADPKAWSLLASNDGETWETLHSQSDTLFSVRSERYYADVTTIKTNTHFRLVFDCNDAQTQFSLADWQLLGLCADQPASLPINAAYLPTGKTKLSAYSITIGEKGSAPTAWKLEGSPNGTSWKVIDTQAEAEFPFAPYTAIYRVSPTDSYLYYRLTISEEGKEVANWQIIGTPDYGTFYADLTEIAAITSGSCSNIGALIDDDGATYCDLRGQGAAIDVNLPIATKLLGYSLVSADDEALDPKRIEVSGIDEDGTTTVLSTRDLTFTVRGLRQTITVSTTKQYKHFRLSLTDETQDHARLAALELYGAAIAAAAETVVNTPAIVEASAEPLSTTEGINRLYDGNRSTQYRASFTEPAIISYGYDAPVKVNTYAITAGKTDATRDPAAWTLEGSKDGTDWVLLDAREAETFSTRYATQFYRCTEGEYSQYRLTVVATAGSNQLQMTELQLLSLEENQTAIAAPARFVPGTDNRVYDLSGRKVADSPEGLRPGLYIIGGRKVLR